MVLKIGHARVTLSAAALTIVGTLPVFLLSTQATAIGRDLDFGASGLGLSVSVFFLAAALAAGVGGSRFDRLAPGAMVSLAASICLAATGLLAWTASTHIALVALMALAGAGNGAMQLAANVLISRYAPQENQGLAFAIKQSSTPIALMIGGIAISAVIAAQSWRWSFAGVAIVAAIIAVGALRAKPSDLRAAPRPHSVSVVPNRMPDLLATASFALAGAATFSMTAFVPTWVLRVGISPVSAGYLIAACSILAVVMRLVSGARADRKMGRDLSVVAVHLFGGAVGLTLLSIDDPRTTILGSVLAFALGWGWPGLFVYSIVKSSRNRAGRASGLVISGGFFGGAFGPIAFGAVADGLSYPAAWLGCAATMVAAALLALAAQRAYEVRNRGEAVAQMRERTGSDGERSP